MMTTSSSASRRSARAVAITCAVAFAAITAMTACADKGLLRPKAEFSPKMSLQVTITADQQAAFGPRFLVAAAGFDGESNGNNNDDEGGGFLGKAIIPFTAGTHTLTVPIDLSPCLAYWSEKGRDYCPLLIGAAIVPDTNNFADNDSTGGDIFDGAFDFYFDGPYPIAPGGALPTIRPIDLSVSRFGVVQWEGDNALQLGGSATPNGFSGASISGVPGAGAAPPTLFATTQGFINSFSSNNQGSQGPYPVLAINQNGVWRRVFATVLPTQSQPFGGVTVLSPTEAYMPHRTGLYKFDGTSISKITAVTDSVFSVGSVVTGAGAKLVIAGGWNGVAWIGNGTTWTRYVLPSAPLLGGGVCITGPNEAFAAAAGGTASGNLYRFDGANWTSVPAPNNTAGKVNLQCPAPGQAFVISQSGQRLSWNGSTWITLPTTGLAAGGRSLTWAVVSPTEIYAAGDSANVDRAFYRFNGTTWQEIGRGRFTQQIMIGWADPRGAAYFGSQAFGRVEKASGTSVNVVSYAPSLRDVAMNSLTSAFVVGDNLFLGRWDGAKWAVDAPPAGVTTNRFLRGVWSDGAKNAWAVGPGAGGSVFRYDGVGWSSVPVGVTDNWQAVWGTGSDVWITGNTNIVHCKAPTACSTESSGGTNTLFSVWGTSNTNVFAVGAAGRIARFNGTTWSEMTRPTGRTLLRVAGSGPSDVWAVGDSVILHFDGSQWATVVDSLDDLRQRIGRGQTLQNGGPNNVGILARGPKEMYFTANFGNVARWNGSRWSDMNLSGFRHAMMGISGIKPDCALGVAEAFSDPASPTLYRGIGPSGCLLAPMAAPTSWP